jgi:glycosyltransferase involved in cell wall biosynthesis
VRILVYVPAYNAGRFLEATLARLPAPFLARVDSILIVDNASTDDTAAAAEACRVRYAPKVEIIRNRSNAGYGGSQKIAYRYAPSGLRPGCHAARRRAYALELIESLCTPIEQAQPWCRRWLRPCAADTPLH